MVRAKFLRVAMAALLAAAMPAGAPARAKDGMKLHIGTEGAFPPFNYADAAGALHGFEIDLARAVCARAKAQCEFGAESFEHLIPALIAGKYDVLFASLAMTDERRKIVDFSDRYYQSPSLFVVRKESGLTAIEPSLMRGRTIGAKAGSVQARFLQDVYAPAGAAVKLYVTQSEVNLDLASGRLDASVSEKLVIMSWLDRSQQGDCCQVVGPDLADPTYFGSGVGAAFRKGKPELKALIDKALAELRADGAFERINAKYFPFKVY